MLFSGCAEHVSQMLLLLLLFLVVLSMFPSLIMLLLLFQDGSTPVTPHRDGQETDQQVGVANNNGTAEQPEKEKVEEDTSTPPPVPKKQKRLINQVAIYVCVWPRPTSECTYTQTKEAARVGPTRDLLKWLTVCRLYENEGMQIAKPYYTLMGCTCRPCPPTHLLLYK